MSEFKVKKGKKYFRGPKWNFLGKNKKGFKIRGYFWDNCKYTLNENQGQINKLAGQSLRLFPFYDSVSKKVKPGHHKDSVRFGWRCTDKQIEILAYVYMNGVRKEKSITKVSTGCWFIMEFKETDSYYAFKVHKGDGVQFVEKFKKTSTKKGFLGLFINRLYPYFGGRVSAPHDMRIYLEY